VVTLIGSLAAVLTTACWLPQVLKTMRLGEAADFAWPYLVMLLAGVTAWATYGVLRHDPPLYVCNVCTGLLVLAVVGVKRRAERTRPQEIGVEAAVD
jgi:MtN3 and saliva related transmembrane protein